MLKFENIVTLIFAILGAIACGLNIYTYGVSVDLVWWWTMYVGILIVMRYIAREIRLDKKFWKM